MTTFINIQAAGKLVLFLNAKKITCRKVSTGLFVFAHRKQKGKGRGETGGGLMGKCKSSPYFETTQLRFGCFIMLLCTRGKKYIQVLDFFLHFSKGFVRSITYLVKER